MVRVAIASGKGGTGKTFVSVNLFKTLVNIGKNVSLADCDAEEPNAVNFFKLSEVSKHNITQWVPVIDKQLCTHCVKCQEWCVYNAIMIIKERQIAKVMEEMCHGCGACSVACDYGAITEKEVTLGEISTFREKESEREVVEGRIRVGVYTPVPVLKGAISSAKGDIVIMDSPPGTSCPFIHTVNAANFVILVTEPTPFGLNDLKISVAILREMGRPFSVIINRAGLGGNLVHDYLKEENIDLLGEIPFDREIAEVYSTGGTVIDRLDSVTHIFKQIGEDLLNKIGEGRL